MMESYGTYQALVADIRQSGAGIKLDRLTYVIDPGIAIHPDQITAQIHSGAVTGLLNTLRAKITLEQGRVQQSNFHNFPLLRMSEMPEIRVIITEGGPEPGGMGEVGVPLIAPAIANAVFALTGKRVRSLPLADSDVHFV
jgi:isoquinoline 1-oxidoreductase beta subunit